MRWGWPVLLALLLAPTAQSCSLVQPSPETLVWMRWEDGHRLVFGWDGSFQVADVTAGRVGWAPTPQPSPYVHPGEPSASSPDGQWTLRVRHEAQGTQCHTGESGTTTCTQTAVTMTHPCGGPAYTRRLGVELVNGTGASLRQWGQDDLWSGSLWGNGTHGFVWDAGARRLSRLAWSDPLAFDDHLLQVPASHSVQPHMFNPAPLMSRDRLLLTGTDGIAVIDPAGPAVRLLPSPYPGGFSLDAGDDHVFFGRWEGESPSGVLSAAMVDVDAQETRWTAQGSGSDYHWTRTSLLIVSEPEHQARLWVEGEELAPIALGDGTADLLAQEDSGLLAMAIRSHQPRLLVLGAANLQTVFDYDGEGGPEPTSVSDTWSGWQAPSGPDSGQSSGAERGSPGLPWTLALVALALALVRRR